MIQSQSHFQVPRIGVFPFVERFHTPDYSIYKTLTREEYMARQAQKEFDLKKAQEQGGGDSPRFPRRFFEVVIHHAYATMGIRGRYEVEEKRMGELAALVDHSNQAYADHIAQLALQAQNQESNPTLDVPQGVRNSEAGEGEKFDSQPSKDI